MSYGRVREWVDAHRDWCFDLLRIYLGCGLLAKGVLFASSPDMLTGWWQQGGMQAVPVLLAHCVVLAHLCGGFMMAIGLLTRVAAAAQIPILFSAVFFVHREEGLFSRAQNLEFSLLVLFLLVLVFLHGSGRWSADRYLFAKQRERHGEGRAKLA